MTVFSGYDLSGRYAIWNFGYRRWLANDLILRASVGIGQKWYFDTPSGYEKYLSSDGTNNYFERYEGRANNILQLNAGAEKILRKGRVSHAEGFQVFVNHRTFY